MFDPTSDPLGSGYHIIQSKIAVGSGGLFGKGFLNGTQSQLEFLPERGTDFIFAVFAEEFGFIGILILFLFYLILIARCIHIAGNAKNYFSKIIAGSITSIFILLIITNISMAIGVLPVVGVTLPLLSLGGSSLLSIFIAFGIIFSVNRRN
jgi:rod shape determining protein RodA